MKKFSLSLLMFLSLYNLQAQITDPQITSWIQTPGVTGYSGLAANVQAVNYSTTDVYVTCTCIPGYDIGPWAGNPNTPANQNFCFKITRTPAEKTGNKTATGLGHVGVWTNGVSMFNSLDAMSYNNAGVWHQDALPNEGASFDDCLGHPAPNGEYHHHVNPTCLYDDQNSTVHSPIIGWSFDGYPVYGAYGYLDPSQPSTIVRMTSGYRKRSITTRTTLPNGTNAPSAGPAVSAQYSLGKYVEDYEYVQGLGSLDPYNGRWCVTPDYPDSIYAYFVTIDSNQVPVYPYTIGPSYFGVIPQGAVGPQSGHNTIPGTAVNYTTAATGITELSTAGISTYPNPVSDVINIDFGNAISKHRIQLIDMSGRQIVFLTSTEKTAQIYMSEFAIGIYLVKINDEDGKTMQQKILKQ